MIQTCVRSIPLMGTIVTIEVVGPPSNGSRADCRAAAIDRAFDWFREVERRCSRFDPQSDVRRASERVGVAVPVSDVTFAALEFAVAVAEETDGAFDPTVGHQMEVRGFNRDYRTSRVTATGVVPDGPVSYRDVQLEPGHRTVRLGRPLLLDLGAVAKGLAIDLAAKELAPFESFAIDAGGDLYLSGTNDAGTPWAVGIRHPRRDSEVLETLQCSNVAVCTSGDYERRDGMRPSGHHILDPRNGRSAGGVVSATVVAPTAMLADALATAAFVLGPDEGIRLLERHGVDGLLVTATLDELLTAGMRSAYRRPQQVLSDA